MNPGQTGISSTHSAMILYLYSHNMRPILQISGIRDLHDARYCAAVGIGLLGFNFSRHRERQISAAAVGEILSWVNGPEAVGGFSYEPPAEIISIAATAQLSYVNLPIDYLPEEAALLPMAVIYRVESENDLFRISKMEEEKPDVRFEMTVEFLQLLHPGMQKSLLPKTLLLAENPDAVWALSQVNGALPWGFVLGDFIMQEGGQVNYDSCDSFLEQLTLRLPN
jgi:hypothetical protein